MPNQNPPNHQPPPKGLVRARIIPNPAAAALGIGIRPDKWQPASMIDALTSRYLQLIKLSEEAKERKDTRQYRLSLSGAFELAQFIASYHQDMGDPELFSRWERRAKQASAGAYRPTNPAVSALGTPPPDPAQESSDD